MSSSKIQEYNLDPNMGLAKESTSQEILEKVGNTGEAQNKTYTNTVVGLAHENGVTINGCGRITCCPSVGCKIKVDGVTEYSVSEFYQSNANGPITVFFNSSVTLKGYSSNKFPYIVQT